MSWRQADFSDMRIGFHLRAPRLGALYFHHGVYIGRGQLVHFVEDPRSIIKKSIAITPLQRFVGESADKVEYRVVADRDHYRKVLQRAGILVRACEILRHRRPLAECDTRPFSPAEILALVSYNLAANNCETVAHWIATGKDFGSEQVRWWIGPCGEALARAVRAITNRIESTSDEETEEAVARL